MDQDAVLDQDKILLSYSNIIRDIELLSVNGASAVDLPYVDVGDMRVRMAVHTDVTGNLCRFFFARNIAFEELKIRVRAKYDNNRELVPLTSSDSIWEKLQSDPRYIAHRHGRWSRAQHSFNFGISGFELSEENLAIAVEAIKRPYSIEDDLFAYKEDGLEYVDIPVSELITLYTESPSEVEPLFAGFTVLHFVGDTSLVEALRQALADYLVEQDGGLNALFGQLNSITKLYSNFNAKNISSLYTVPLTKDLGIQTLSYINMDKIGVDLLDSYPYLDDKKYYKF